VHVPRRAAGFDRRTQRVKPKHRPRQLHSRCLHRIPWLGCTPRDIATSSEPRIRVRISLARIMIYNLAERPFRSQEAIIDRSTSAVTCDHWHHRLDRRAVPGVVAGSGRGPANSRKSAGGRCTRTVDCLLVCSQTARPPALCPPPRAEMRRSCSRAKRTHAITSDEPVHHAMIRCPALTLPTVRC
jgi:hypothetical protein